MENDDPVESEETSLRRIDGGWCCWRWARTYAFGRSSAALWQLKGCRLLGSLVVVPIAELENMLRDLKKVQADDDDAEREEGFLPLSRHMINAVNVWNVAHRCAAAPGRRRRLGCNVKQRLRWLATMTKKAQVLCPIRRVHAYVCMLLTLQSCSRTRTFMSSPCSTYTPLRRLRSWAVRSLL